MLKSILEKIDPKVGSGMETIALDILGFVEQTHIYHLLTKAYSDHMAIGEFYESIQEHADSLVETYIGINDGNFLQSGKHSASFNLKYDKATLIKELDAFRSKIVKGIDITTKNEYLSLNDILIDIQSDIDTLKYKLNFN